MSKRFASTLFASMTLLFSPADAAAAARVQPGHWESKMTMAPSAKPMAVKYCITPAEAALMNGDLPALRKYLVDSTKAEHEGPMHREERGDQRQQPHGRGTHLRKK